MTGRYFSLHLGIAWLAAGMLGAHAVLAQSSDNSVLQQIFNEPVTSSATGRPQLASEAPANIDIVTAEDIRRSGATTIPDALQFLPGVYVHRYGIADVDVGIRGYDQPYNPRLLVLVNGREVFEQAYGHVAWAEIPVQMDEIRQIEVIKGPNSALYGFNAVSGVINIVTYDPLSDDINVATLRGGTQNYASGSVVGTGKFGDAAGVRLSAGGLEANDFASGQLPAADADIRSGPKIGTFDIDARAHPAPNVDAFLEASAADTRYSEEIYTATFDNTSRRTNSLRAGGSVDTGLGLVSLSAYRNEALVSLDLPPAFSSITNWYREDLYVVEASLLSKPAADHTVRIGLEYRNNSGLAPGFTSGTIGYQVYAASAMWNWQIAPSLALTNAVRVDTLDLNYAGTLAPGSGYTLADYNQAAVTAISFNSGLVYEATEQDTLRLMAARGVQLPSLLDFGQQSAFGTFGPIVVSGNPSVRPTIVQNIELDYDRSLPVWKATARTALFAQRSDDIISQPFSSAPRLGPAGLPVLTTTNAGSSEAFGGEFALHGETSIGVRWNASYALVSTTDHTTLNRAGPATSAIDYALSVPRDVISGGAGYTWNQVELDMQALWQSSYRDYRYTGYAIYLQPVEIRNYVTVNGRAAYKLTEHVTVAVTGQQLETSRLYQTAGPPVERRLIVSLTARF